MLPVPVTWLDGSTPIERGYPKPYTPDQMREWMRQVAAINRCLAEDRHLPVEQRRLERYQTSPADAEERALGETYRTLFRDDGPNAIRASLDASGRLEIDQGRHRVHYAREQGAAVLPVWVSTPTAADATRLAARCRAATDRVDPALSETYRLEVEQAGARRDRTAADEVRSRDDGAERGRGR
jgi:hypothetical protein